VATDRIRLTKDKETYLATRPDGDRCRGRAADPRRRFAADAAARFDYDFPQLTLRRGEITLPMRDRHFDQWRRAFPAANDL
jgi:hypothetical protein